jgi:threonine/homoserine/homoserine lactone efflux protein
MRLTGVVALLLFATAGSGSPGPNNTFLLTSGVRFGFRRTLPHVVGTTVGISALIVAVAAGLGVALAALPAAQVALKIAGSLYLTYLAYGLARNAGVDDAGLAAPLTVGRAVTFQFVNPKGWIFAVAVVSAFLPTGPPPLVGGLAIAAVVAAVVTATAVIWASGGAALNHLLRDDRSRRAVTVALAVLMVASVALLWV